MQFCRFLSALPATGRVILMLPPPLHDLFRPLGNFELADSHCLPWPAHDVRVPYLALPALLGMTDLPRAPYLRFPTRIPDRLRLTPTSALRIGFAWRGSDQDPWAWARACPLSEWGPLFALPGIDWVSLQVGPYAADLDRTGRHAHVTDLSDRLLNFQDTAAVIQQCNLIISVCTAVAHLAGALGCPTWLLLSEPAHYRWPRTGFTTNWYPSMRLFRQARPGSWDAPMAEMADGLSATVSLRGPHGA